MQPAFFSRPWITMALDVFISYAIADKLTADAACAALEAEGIRCWIAPRDVLPGMDYAEAIIEAIEKARGMLLIFSSNANRSNQVKREVERAVHHGIPIIPFRIEDVPPNRALEYFISAPHWLDALTPPLEQHLKHLASTIRMLLSRNEVGSEASTAQSRSVSGRVAAGPGSHLSGSSSTPVGSTSAPANQPGTRAGSSNVSGSGYQFSSNVQPNSSGAAVGVPVTTIPRKSNAPLMIFILVGVVAVIVAGMVGIGVVAFFLLQHAVPRPSPYANVTPTPLPRATASSTPFVVQTTPTPGTIPTDNYSDAQSALAAAASYEKSGNYEKAIAAYDAALGFDAKNAETLNKRANCYKQLAQNDKAIADYDAAIEINSNNPNYFNDRGIAYWRKGDYDRAIAD